MYYGAYKLGLCLSLQIDMSGTQVPMLLIAS
jgi:hypothetical protein